LKQLVHWKLN